MGSLFDSNPVSAEELKYVRQVLQSNIDANTPPGKVPLWYNPPECPRVAADEQTSNDPTLRPGPQGSNAGISPRERFQAIKADLAGRCDRIEREHGREYAELRRLVGAIFTKLDGLSDRLDAVEVVVADLAAPEVTFGS